MPINLKEKCEQSKKKEFYYGAKLNKNIKDCYLGMGYLEPQESNRRIGPGRGHEEIIYILNGVVSVEIKKGDSFKLKQGEVYHFPDKQKIRLTNLSAERSYFIIAGGHTKHHHH